MAHVSELGGQVVRFTDRAGEDEAALEHGEDVVREGGEVYGGGGGRSRAAASSFSSSRSRHSRMESAITSRGAVAGELALVDEGDEQAARLGGAAARRRPARSARTKLTSCSAGSSVSASAAAMNSSSRRPSAAAYRSSSASPSSFLERKMVARSFLAGRRRRNHGVDARGGKAALEHESLGRHRGSVRGLRSRHGASVDERSKVADRPVCLI